jgi:hypothetical protein
MCRQPCRGCPQVRSHRSKPISPRLLHDHHAGVPCPSPSALPTCIRLTPALAAAAAGPYLAAPCSASATCSHEPRRMPKLRVYHDGWLALPAAVRRKLGLSTGAQLELELTGGVVLRPPRGPDAADIPPAEPVTTAPSQTQPPEPKPAATATLAPVVKRGPGRPQKTATAPAALPPSLKARGRRMTAPPARPAAPQPTSTPASPSAARRGPGRPPKTPTPAAGK